MARVAMSALKKLSWNNLRRPTLITAVCALFGTVAVVVSTPPVLASTASPTEAIVAGAFQALAPARLLDTRTGTGAIKAAVPAHTSITLAVAGSGGVPNTGAAAAALNITVTAPTTAGYITVYPTGTTLPTASNLNFAKGQTIPNLVLAKLGTNGSVNLYNGSTGTVELIADVSGYVLAGSAPPVTDLDVDGVTTSGVSLVWTNPSDPGFDGVTIRRAVGSTPPATSTSATLAVQTSGAANAWSDTGLMAGQTYSYALFAETDGIPGPAASVTVTVPVQANLTGTVAGPSGAVPGATVRVTNSSGLEVAHVTTAADGTYSVAGLTPGGYAVCFSPASAGGGPGGLGYLPQCWNHVDPAGTPATVWIADGVTVTGISADLATAGSVSGTVSNGASQPIAGVVVSVDKPGGDPVAYAVTDSGGHWTVPGLLSGAYGVCFDPSQLEPAAYAAECYDNVAPDAAPNLVAVTQGSAATNINATLAAVPLSGPTNATKHGSASGGSAAAQSLPYNVYPSTSLGSLLCADVLFLAARGSGESGPGGAKEDPGDGDAGIGGPVRTAYESFTASLTDGRSVTRPVSVSYPADNVLPNAVIGSYIPDLWKGVKEVRRALTERAAHCPNERIVLAGYSQGAMVMHRILTNAITSGVTDQLPSAILNRIDALILIADGDRVANDTTTKYGSARPSAQGVGTQLDHTAGHDRLSQDQGAETLSICNAGDAVCDFRVRYVPGCDTACVIAQLAAGIAIHLSYTDSQVVRDAGAEAAALAESVPAVGGDAISVVGTVGLPLNRQLSATYNPYYVDSISWAPAPGAHLPAGLTLDSGGLLHGTPSAATSGDVELRITTTNLGVARSISVESTFTVVPPDFPTAWSAAAAPMPSGANPSRNFNVRAVACPGGASCEAIGDYDLGPNDDRPLMLVGAGDAWVSVPLPQPQDPNNPKDLLYDIACAAVTSCVAVGHYSYPSSYQNLGQHPVLYVGSGSDWSRLQPPLPADAATPAFATLQAVTCPLSTLCVAAGSYLSTTGQFRAYLLTGSGTSWSVSSTALPPDAGNDNGLPRMADIACSSSTACAAVGYYYRPGGVYYSALVVSGSGDSWTAISPSLPAGVDPTYASSQLGSVSCPVDADCVAVGAYYGGGRYYGLIATGSNASWESQQAPWPADSSPNGAGTGVQSVSCPSGDSCTAVGTYLTVDGTDEALLLTRSPSGWSAQSAPLPADASPRQYADDHSTLSAVDCPESGSCLAVGRYETTAGTIAAFVIGTTGQAWVSNGVPLPAGSLGSPVEIPSIDCVSTFFCAAVGSYPVGVGVLGGLVLTGPIGG
jgi:hypothetical protein